MGDDAATHSHTETIKDLIVKKRGKRYFDWPSAGTRAKAINEVSDGLALDTVAKMQPKDFKTTPFRDDLDFS